ncbi:hypothetical protein L3i20_v233780 [Paenibacillus sp. L3-i20]|nr:hypothetical protein L3i20_v233780 [Paenibacillus sp. L3-i20]
MLANNLFKDEYNELQLITFCHNGTAKDYFLLKCITMTKWHLVDMTTSSSYFGRQFTTNMTCL